MGICVSKNIDPYPADSPLCVSCGKAPAKRGSKHCCDMCERGFPHSVDCSYWNTPHTCICCKENKVVGHRFFCDVCISIRTGKKLYVMPDKIRYVETTEIEIKTKKSSKRKRIKKSKTT